MTYAQALELLTNFVRESGLIPRYQSPTVSRSSNTTHDGKNAWVLHTGFPIGQIYVVFHQTEKVVYLY